MWISGLHPVKACLSQGHVHIKVLYLSRKQSEAETLAALAVDKGVSIQWTDKKEISADQKLAQGVGALCAAFPYYQESDLSDLVKQDSVILLLDSIQDPHNFGACLRTADAIGASAVLIPKDKSVSVTDTVAKVSSGAFASIPIVRVVNLVHAMERLKALNVWVYGAASEAKSSLYQTDFSQGSVALVMGSEGKGLRRLVRERCDALLSIPMHGAVESLNVSVAAAVCLYEIRRQKPLLNR